MNISNGTIATIRHLLQPEPTQCCLPQERCVNAHWPSLQTVWFTVGFSGKTWSGSFHPFLEGDFWHGGAQLLTMSILAQESRARTAKQGGNIWSWFYHQSLCGRATNHVFRAWWQTGEKVRDPLPKRLTVQKQPPPPAQWWDRSSSSSTRKTLTGGHSNGMLSLLHTDHHFLSRASHSETARALASCHCTLNSYKLKALLTVQTWLPLFLINQTAWGQAPGTGVTLVPGTLGWVFP